MIKVIAQFPQEVNPPGVLDPVHQITETGNAYAARGNAFVDASYQRIVDAIDSRNGIAPQVVAHTIVRALRAARPRFHYLVGLNAVKAHWAKRLLGTRLALWLMAKFFGFRFSYDA